jgi:flagellin
MAFSINTNIASLQAQNYLQTNSNFQSHTISQVTSGLRIVNSGDDAAGLAIANGFRSDEAVLTQGIQNANNGLSTLQTIDSGMSNISTLLDRARTLATESASGTFTGNRSTLNSEFQSVMTEINRQSQSIGLNQNGAFAQDLSVFIGGGRSSGNTSAINNGSIDLNLTNSAVDTQSLGLTAYNAQASTAYNLGTGATSVANVLATAANGTTGYTTFTFTGSGFGDTKIGGTLNQNAVTVSVNLNNITDTASLVNAINNAITAQGNQGSANDTAFKNAGISAKFVTDSSGNQMIAFASSNSVFQVQAGDKMANAILGNFASGSTGAAITAPGSSIIAGGTQQITSSGSPKTFSFTAPAAAETQALTFTTNDASGAVHNVGVSLSLKTTSTVDDAVEAINNTLQTQQDPTLSNIVAFKDATGAIAFASAGKQFSVTIGVASATAAEGVGTSTDQGTIFTSSTVGAASTQDISTQTGADNAITALATAVQNLGTAQAAVGKGENNLNYAINLAQSQVTNEAASESQLRDANLAQQAANLTKAQILVQAGTAALAQANSAPQQLLSLLKG